MSIPRTSSLPVDSSPNLSAAFASAAIVCCIMKWTSYAIATQVFAGLSFVFLAAILGGIDKRGLKNLSYLISTLHAALVAVCAFLLLQREPFDALDDLLPRHIAERTLFQVSMGYLLADTTYVSLWYMPRSTVVHHVVGILGLALGQRLAMGRGLALYFLLTEASTVPLNLCWYLREKKVRGWREALSGAVLLTTFCGVRVVPIPFVLHSILSSIQPPIIVAIALCASAPMMALNGWWMYRLLSIAAGYG